MVARRAARRGNLVDCCLALDVRASKLQCLSMIDHSLSALVWHVVEQKEELLVVEDEGGMGFKQCRQAR
jgi:hypothetical protein